ncbi:carboxypeptidase regulatory-like domain-containing protein [Candidatus Woesearchaeota archaeon]|nr:MAG: carboxypeptidase regulatory-like domain-containing protein [Candidatus Woesearchaeota archaeon]
MKPSFSLSVSPENVSVNSTLLIKLSAPQGTTVELNIATPSTVDSYFTQADHDTVLIYIPTEPGKYTVSATFTFESYSVEKSESFTAFSPSSIASGNETPSNSSPSNSTSENETSSSDASNSEKDYYLTASIIASKKQAFRGDSVSFGSKLSLFYGNGTPANESMLSSCSLDYSWDVKNDGSAEGTQSSFSYRFTETGTFPVFLSVSGVCQNDELPSSLSATDTVSVSVVKPSFDVILKVVESFTQRPVPEAVLSVFPVSSGAVPSVLVKTNTHGTATLTLTEGDYYVNISKEGYEPTVSTITISKSDVLTFTLFKKVKKTVVPTVKITNAPSSVSSPNPSATISYSVSSDTEITECTLFYQLEDFRGWRVGGTHAAPSAGSTQSFVLSSLQSGTYRYRIRCSDADRDEGFSEIRTFSVVNEREETLQQLSGVAGSSNSDSGSSQEIELLLKRFDDVIISLDSLSGNRKQVADALALVRKAKQNKERARSLYDSYRNYRKMGLSPDLLVKKKQETINSIQQILDSTVFNVVELREHEFISVVNRDYVASLAEDFLKANSVELSEENLRKYLSAVLNLNEGVDIYTTATLVELRFGSGSSEYLTLLDERFDIPDFVENRDDVVLALEIPGSIVPAGHGSDKQYSDIISVNPFKVLQSSSDRTLLSISPAESAGTDAGSDYRYSALLLMPASPEYELSVVEQMKSALVFRNIDLRKKSSFGSAITGLSVLDSPGKKVRLVASEVIILLAALSLSLFLYSKYVSPSKPLSVEEMSRKLSESFDSSFYAMKKGVVLSSDLKTFEKALSLYRNAPPVLQTMFFDKFREVWDYVNFHSAKERMKQFYTFLSRNDIHRAKIALADAKSIADSLPYRYRNGLVKHLGDAELALSSLSQNRNNNNPANRGRSS